MTRTLAVLAFVVLPTALVAWGMWRGYLRRRARDTAALAPLPDAAPPGRPPDAVVRYTGTTRDGHWLEQVALDGLFGRGPCRLWAEPGAAIFARDRGPVVRAPVVAVSIERGHANQFAPRGRALVVRWRHVSADGEPVDLDSGFVCPTRDDAARLAAALETEVAR